MNKICTPNGGMFYYGASHTHKRTKSKANRKDEKMEIRENQKDAIY